MGYKSRLKKIRSLLGGDKRPTRLEDMIECPFCHAWSYPRAIRDPKNDEEKEAILCGACRKDVMPIIKARKAAAEAEQQKNTLTEAPIISTDNPRDAPIEIGATITQGEQNETGSSEIKG